MITLRLALVLALVIAADVSLHAEGSVPVARELYASAAYDDALKMLDGLQSGSLTVEERQTIGLYRALCFVALGRAADAESAIETLITENPVYRPAMDDLPPRMRTAFTEARRRLLPAMIQRQYADGKAAFDREDFAAAAAAFSHLLEAFADPDVAAAANQPPLSDLEMLATGFHDLSMKELELPPLPLPAPVIVALPAPVKPARDFTKIYTVDDADVASPAVIRQTFPPFPGRISSRAVGVIEVLIDTGGAVETAALLDPVHPQYDQIAVAAARKWRYQPAMVDGVPVRFAKRVQITLTPAP